MIECKTTTRKWGNSIGVTLPKEVIDQGNIKENEQITLLIPIKKTNLKELFGTLKGKWKKSAQEIKDETRAELYND